MAFPQVVDADTQSGSVTVDSTSWTLTYPTNLQRNDLILAFLGTDGAPTVTFPAGWVTIGPPVGGVPARLVPFGKQAIGTEVGNFTVTLDVAEQGVWRVLRITNWYGALVNYTGTAGPSGYLSVTDTFPINTTVSLGTSTTPDPGLTNPYSWGAEDTLWIAVYAVDGAAVATAYPTNYVNGVTQSSGGATGAGLGLAFRELNAASEDAGAFTIDISEEWGACTFAIRGDNAPAEFPKVGGMAQTRGIAATTSAVVDLPSVVNAGDTLLVLHRSAVGTASHGYPGAWTVLFNDNSDASDDRTSCAWLEATGTEGGTTISITQTSSKFASIAWVIRSATDPNIRAPEFATLATGTSTLPDPNSLSPTGGAKNYLWIWMGGWEGEQTSPPASAPTSYDSQVGTDSGTAAAITTNVRVASAHRFINATSEDPGSWTISASDDWTATVVAVHPGPPVDFGEIIALQGVNRGAVW